MSAPVTLGLGIDCGPTRSGVALVELGVDGWPAILWGGHVESHGPELRTQLVAAIRRGALIAIEHLQGYAYEANRVAQLIETGHAEGRIYERALGLIEATALAAGRPSKVREITANDWRGALCRSEVATDDQIRIVVEGLCRVRPTPKADARPHIWDAAGLAIVALARENGRAIQLPSAVSAALHMQQVTEKAERASGTRKPAAKRSETKAQRERRGAAAKAAWAARKAGA